MEFSLKVVALRRVLRLISGWGDEVLFRIAEKCVWLQVFHTRVSIMQIELDISKLIKFTSSKDDFFFSLNVNTLNNIIKFADLDGIARIHLDKEGELIWFEFTVEERDKHVEVCVPQSNPNSQGFIIDTEYTTSVNVLTKEFKGIIENFSLFHDKIYIEFQTKKQIVFSATNDKANIIVSLDESVRKSTPLRLKCSSGIFISTKGVDSRRAFDFVIPQYRNVTVDLKYLRKVIGSIENLRSKPIYIKIMLFNDEFPLSLEFTIPDVGTIKYFIALLLEEKEDD